MVANSIPESDIRIDAEGVWSYRGAEMIRREIIRLFYQHLRQDDSGGCFIEIGQQRYPVYVEDTAFVVWALSWAENRDGEEECAYLLLSDESIEKLNPGTLRIAENNIPYCRVRNGGFEARFSRSSYYRLAERVQYDFIINAHVISLNGQTYRLSE
jgi:hypothetical protein